MRKITRLGVLFIVGILVASPVFGQGKQPQVVRRPPAVAVAGTETAQPKTPDGSGASYILDGLPMLLALHHDTEVGTNKPVDVYMWDSRFTTITRGSSKIQEMRSILMTRVTAEPGSICRTGR